MQISPYFLKDRLSYECFSRYQVGSTLVEIAAGSLVHIGREEILNRDSFSFGPVMRSGETKGVITGAFDGMGTYFESFIVAQMAAEMLVVYACERDQEFDANEFIEDYFEETVPDSVHSRTMVERLNILARTNEEIGLDVLVKEHISPVLHAYREIVQKECGTTAALQLHREACVDLYFQGDTCNIWREGREYFWGGEHTDAAEVKRLSEYENKFPLERRDELIGVKKRNIVSYGLTYVYPFLDHLEVLNVSEADIVMSMTDGFERLRAARIKEVISELDRRERPLNIVNSIIRAAGHTRNTDDKTIVLARRSGPLVPEIQVAESQENREGFLSNFRNIFR